MHSFETNNTSVPAFLIKLWKLVEDPSCNELIAWSDSGTSFIIKDQITFSKELLPQYFKHNNMASFIRQLNMYGFRKVMNYEKSGLRNENDEMEFQHTFFSKGNIGLLAHIKRKIPNTKVSEPTVKSNARDILTDLSSIREKQENMDNMLSKMKQENELLWRELTSMRKKHKAQEHVIQKVIQFLVSIVQRSNQNISVPRKISRMLQDSSENQENTQVSGAIDVLRKKNSNIITMSEDKLVSPLGPVIHEITDLDHDNLESQLSPSVKSPEDKRENNVHNLETDNQESSYPFDNSSLNSPINSSNMEELSILEPLQHNTPAVNSDDGTVEESVLGIPLEYIADSPCNNVISIPDDESCDKIISLPVSSNSDSCIPYTISSTPNMLVYTTTKSDYVDSLLSESLNTPKIPSIHIEDLFTPDTDTEKKDGESRNENGMNSKTELQKHQQQQQNEHNYQLALSDSSNALKSSSLTNKEKRCNNLISNSEMRFHSSLPTVERRNSLSNHVINVEEELKWLQEQISGGSWNTIDSNKLLGLFSTDDVAHNETLAEDIADQITIKSEPSEPVDNIVGNELAVMQFTPSMLEVDLDLGMGNNQFLQCLNQDEVVSTVPDINKSSDDQKNFLTDVLKTDQAAASEAAEYFLSSGAAKQKSPRRPKIQKLKTAKRRKLK